MRISDWSSDVCSSDLPGEIRIHIVAAPTGFPAAGTARKRRLMLVDSHCHLNYKGLVEDQQGVLDRAREAGVTAMLNISTREREWGEVIRSEEPTSELQSLMRISYAVFCLKKKKH